MAEKSNPLLTETRIAAGWWEGILTGAGTTAPAVEALHGDRVLAGVEVTALPGKAKGWAVRVPIPADILSEGVQTVLLRLGEVELGHFTLSIGQAVDQDLRAEVALLRAELDLLKRAFRRHCAETQA